MKTKNCMYTLLCGTLSLCFIGGISPIKAITQPVIRLFGAYPEGMSFAIFIMNAFTPLINS